jgi:putative transposase
MILTFKLRHDVDVKPLLRRAFDVAVFTVKNKIRSPNTTFVKDIRGDLPSTIACQVMKKYGHQKTIKEVHNVNLIVPGQGIKYFKETNSIWISCLKLHLENTIPYEFVKINQAEIDKDFVYISTTVKDIPEMTPQCFIGVDRNTTGHIAVAANPETGKIVKLGKMALHTHRKYSAIRRRLAHNAEFGQLKDCKDRESRIVRDLNHKVSKKLVSLAKEQNAALVFEDLNGIRKTKKQHRSFKYALHSWSFYQLQQFVEYKAKLLGVPVLYVDPAYTSQDCSRCGARGQRNGKDFKCPICGHVDHADVNAAFNIALRQYDVVNRYQKEMMARGTLISPIALLAESQATLEPIALRR